MKWDQESENIKIREWVNEGHWSESMQWAAKHWIGYKKNLACSDTVAALLTIADGIGEAQRIDDETIQKLACAFRGVDY